MSVKLLTDCKVEGVPCKAGDIINPLPRIQKKLIDRGLGEIATAEKPKAKAKAKADGN